MMRTAGVAIVIGGWLVSSSIALGADRTADQVLKEIDAVKTPTLDSKKKDDTAVRQESADQAARSRREAGQADRGAVQGCSRP